MADPTRPGSKFFDPDPSLSPSSSLIFIDRDLKFGCEAISNLQFMFLQVFFMTKGYLDIYKFAGPRSGTMKPNL